MTTTEIARRTHAVAPLADKLAYAERLAKSGLLPRDYRERPANVLYAIEYGDMLDLSPMAALTGVHVIDGKPTASAALISALVRRAGHRLRIGYDARTKTGWAKIVRSDDPDFTFESEWDLKRAVDAELCTVDKDGNPRAVDKQGNSKPWKKFYPSMVKARAITEVARDACEEALFGLHYTPEELGADVDEDGIPIAATAERIQQPRPATRTDIDWAAKLAENEGNIEGLRALYKQAGEVDPDNAELAERITEAATRASQVPAAGDDVEDAELVDEHRADAATTPRLATKAQLQQLNIELRKLNLTGRDQRLAVASELVGRRLTTTGELTETETDGLLKQLAKWVESGSADAVIAELLSNPQVMPEVTL